MFTGSLPQRASQQLCRCPSVLEHNAASSTCSSFAGSSNSSSNPWNVKMWNLHYVNVSPVLKCDPFAFNDAFVCIKFCSSFGIYLRRPLQCPCIAFCEPSKCNIETISFYISVSFICLAFSRLQSTCESMCFADPSMHQMHINTELRTCCTHDK